PTCCGVGARTPPAARSRATFCGVGATTSPAVRSRQCMCSKLHCGRAVGVERGEPHHTGDRLLPAPPAAPRPARRLATTHGFAVVRARRLDPRLRRGPARRLASPPRFAVAWARLPSLPLRPPLRPPLRVRRVASPRPTASPWSGRVASPHGFAVVRARRLAPRLRRGLGSAPEPSAPLPAPPAAPC